MILSTFYKILRSIMGNKIGPRELLLIRICDYTETSIIAFVMFKYFIPIADNF